MKKVIEGSHAVSEGVRLAKAEVMAAYPITPQTHIVEALTDYLEKGLMNAELLLVESENSAISAVIGAASGGARSFTATSSHGLLYMHEMLHWAAGARLPIVMAEVNRAVGPPWNIGTDQNDSLSQRDTGWIQLYCEDAQEVLDTTIMAFRLAETVNLPVMVILEGFFLSHTFEPVDIPSQEDVDAFLPPYKPRLRIDTDTPFMLNPMGPAGVFTEMKKSVDLAMADALNRYPYIECEFNNIFRRSYGVVEEYRLYDAETVFVTAGAFTGTAKDAVDRLRDSGEKAGLFKIKMFRPFPTEKVRTALSKADKIAVVDRNFSYGATGIFAQEVRAAMYNNPGNRPPVLSYTAGLGGRDITPDTMLNIYNDAKSREDDTGETIWIDLNPKLMDNEDMPGRVK